MLRLLSLAAALLLAGSLLFLQSLAIPERVLACSCAGPPAPLEQIVEEQPNVAIVVGTMGVPLPDVTPLTVEAWFHGENPQSMVWLRGGSQMISSCDVMYTPGERRFLVLYAEPDQAYSTNICAPGAVLGTPEAMQLLAEAEALFGAGTVPEPSIPPDPSVSPQPSSVPDPSATPETIEPGEATSGPVVPTTPEPGQPSAPPRSGSGDGGTRPTSGGEDGLIWIAGGVVAAVALFGGLALVSRRQPLS